jgi:rRNA maturation protein Nop10
MTQTNNADDAERKPYSENCPTCGGATYTERKAMHVKWACPQCGHIKFIAQPWQTFRLPFGKHKGAVLAQLVKSDPDYCRWMVENCSQPSVKRRFLEAVNALEV